MKIAWMNRTISNVTWRLIGIRLLYKMTNVRKLRTKYVGLASESHSKVPLHLQKTFLSYCYWNNNSFLQLFKVNFANYTKSIAVGRLVTIGVDFGGNPGTCPPIIEKRLCFHQLLPPLPPIFLFPSQYCWQVYTSVSDWFWLQGLVQLADTGTTSQLFE